jgi:uncharacterized membrane protein
MTMGRISRAWSLMGASWQVLKQNKQMMFFSLLSMICCLLVIASFAYPFLNSDIAELERKFSGDDTAQYAYLFVFYFVLYFVIIFFNSAIVANTVAHMEGGKPTFGDGMRVAMNRLPQILGWAALSATVGMILRMIEDKSQWLGKLVAGLLGIAFTVVSFLVIPVLVVEKKGPIEALKESSKLLKKTWGEQVAGSLGFGLLFFLLMLPAFFFVLLMAFTGNMATIIFAAGVALVYMLTLGLIQSTLQGIFQAALFMYARDGKAPEGFREELMENAVLQRRR